MAVELVRYRFTRSEYHRMAEAGILGEDDHVELIEGEIIQMSPIGRQHIGGVDHLVQLFTSRLGDRVIVRVRSPIVLDERNEPEPDITLLGRRDDFYRSSDAGPEAVLLVIEVADSSLNYDRQIKVPLYARYGIPELWIQDLQRDHLAVYCDPTEDGYGTTRLYRRGETITPVAFPDLTIAVDDSLG
jgi:Uma2 family endonuclease